MHKTSVQACIECVGKAAEIERLQADAGITLLLLRDTIFQRAKKEEVRGIHANE